MLSFRTRFVSAAALGLGVFGCSHATDAADTAEQGVAQGFVASVCSDPVASADGKYVLLDLCRGTYIDGGGGVAVVEVATGNRRLVATYKNDARVTRLGESGGRFHYEILRGPNAEIHVGEWQLAKETRSYVVPNAATAPNGASVLLVDDRHVVFETYGSGGKLYVGATGADQLRAVDVMSFYRSVEPSSDGKRLALFGVDNTSGKSFVQTLDLDTGSSLSAQVPIHLSDAEVVKGTFDGSTVLATGRNGAVSVVGRLDVATGDAQAIASGDLLRVVEARGADVWFTTRKRAATGGDTTGDTLAYVARDGSTPAVTLADTNHAPVNGGPGLTAFVSTNGEAILFTVPAATPSSTGVDLYSVPSRTAPTGPTLLRSSVHFKVLQSSGGRHLATIDSSTSVLDDVTGATLETLPVTGGAPELVLSGDGSAVFESRGCKLGAVDGREVDRVSGGREVLLPCSVGFGTGRLERVQHSASVLWVKQSSYLLDGDNRAEVAPRDVTIVAP